MQEHLWQEQARRLGGEDLVSVIEKMGRDLEEIRGNVQHLTTAAFPGGDIDGHRRYHQLIIDNTDAKRALTQAIKEKTISGLIWGMVVWLATSAYAHLPKLFER